DSQVRVGTSGWSYRHWREVFYPDSVPQRQWLEHYMKHFDTVEVNSTFYHLPRESTMESWRDRAPQGFIYALKASRFITHTKMLTGAREPLEEFLRRARLLEEHLGPVLYQLPPRFKRDLRVLERFLDLLPEDLVSVFELRDESWYCEETFGLLASHDACFCAHDMPRLWTPRRGTGPAAYVRFHGPERRYTGAYPEEVLAEWAEWMAGQQEAGRSVFAYFNNDISGHAVHDAKALRTMLAP
ncbi:MAG: DUF72 domain-containing protein, partial [Planctomycetota bacterium]